MALVWMEKGEKRKERRVRINARLYSCLGVNPTSFLISHFSSPLSPFLFLSAFPRPALLIEATVTPAPTRIMNAA